MVLAKTTSAIIINYSCTLPYEIFAVYFKMIRIDVFFTDQQN